LLFQFVIFWSTRKDCVDSPLSQKEAFELFSGASLTIAGALVHPIHSVDTFSATRRLKFLLYLLLSALFFNFLDARLCLFPLGKGGLLCIVDFGLIL
jgi:hypothetical protein